MAGRPRRIVLVVVVAVLCAALAGGLVILWPPARALEAYHILVDLVAGAGPSPLKAATPAPRRETVGYRTGGELRAADLYRPGTRALGAVVLVPGASPHGKDDRQLVAFAHTLARARFLVLVPEIPGLRRLEIGAADARAIADAVAALIPRAPPDGVLGIAAISYAVGPAVLAALSEDVRERVDFVLAIGGYHDIEAVLTFFTTGHYRVPGEAGWRRGTPNAWGKWLFVRQNARRLKDRGDAATLMAIAGRRLNDPTAPVADLAARLRPGGRAVLALATNDDPARVPTLVAALPAPVREELDGLNLSGHDLSGLSAGLVIVHGRDDRIIPFGESVALAAAVPRAELYLLDSLAHAAAQPGGLGDAIMLWRAVGRVLALRDRGARTNP